MEKIIISVVVLGLSFLVNLLVIPTIIRKAHKKKWFDQTDERKVHTGFIPRLGGIGIFSSFAFSALLVSCMLLFTRYASGSLIGLKFLPVFIAFLIIHLTGLIDDFYNLKAIIKLVGQVGAAALIAFSGFAIKSINLPIFGSISFGVLSYPITIFWIISITNAVNLVDGLDGLAGGIGAFSAFSMGVIAIITGNTPVAILSFALLGAIAGFLMYNLPPAKIFMGDSGSLFIGFSLSVIPLLEVSKAASFGTMVIPVTLLIIPIIDTLAAIIRRVREKRGIMSPDRGHIHHKLLDMGFTVKKILVLIYSVCLYLSIIAITSVIMPKASNVYVIIVVWIASVMGYWLINYLKSKKVSFNLNISTDSDEQNTA